jgi:hypothetical protein
MLEVAYFTYFDWIIFLFVAGKRSIFLNYSRALSVEYNTRYVSGATHPL